jgi:hypothetical protein
MAAPDITAPASGEAEGLVESQLASTGHMHTAHYAASGTYKPDVRAVDISRI